MDTYNWDSLGVFFEALNKSTQYVVLRNFENLNCSILNTRHPDIDILCLNRDEMVLATRSVSRSKNEKDISHRAICVRGKIVDLDIRCVGDGYYDTNWEREILRSRVKYEDSFYVPSPENYFYSLLYHVLFQKRVISPDYRTKLIEQAHPLSIEPDDALNIETLQQFMRRNGYRFVYPENPATIANFGIVDKRLVKKSFFRSVQRIALRIKRFGGKLIKL